MALIPNEIIARIKREISIVGLAEAEGFYSKPYSKHYAIHCHFNPDDKSPSLIIIPDVNLCKLYRLSELYYSASR